MPNSPSSSFVLLAATLALAGVARTQSFEPIAADYRNVRGLNYLIADGTGNIPKCGSSTAMWRFFSTPPQGTASTLGPQVAGQLDMLRAIGVNTIRVWLSFPLWKYHDDFGTGPNPFLADLDSFMQTCAAKGIWVMPVFWGSTAEPAALLWTNTTNPAAAGGANAVIDHLTCSRWHAHPGQVALTGWYRLAQQTPNPVPFPSQQAGRFVREVVQRIRTSPALFMWDAANEPGDDSASLWLVQGTLQEIENAYPPFGSPVRRLHPTTVGNGLPWAAVGPVATLAGDPNLDVLSIHVYLHAREGLAGYVDVSRVHGKPLLCTEIGWAGYGQAYEDAVNYSLSVPRPDLSPSGQRGIGFMNWGAMVHPSFPVIATDGMFYPDGTVRSAAAAGAYLEAARRQGVAAGLDLPEERGFPSAAQTAGFLDQVPLRVGHESHAFALARMTEEFPRSIPRSEAGYWYYWAHETQALLVQLHANLNVDPPLPGYGFLANYRTFAPPFLGIGSYSPGWVWSDSWFMRQFNNNWINARLAATLPAAQAEYLVYVLRYPGSLWNMLDIGASTPGAPDVYRFSEPDLALLTGGSTADFIEQRERLLNRIGLMGRLRDVLLNREEGHRADRYLVPGHAVSHGPHTGFGVNLIENPGAEYLRFSEYRLRTDPSTATIRPDPRDGPVGKRAAGWCFVEDRTGISDQIAAQRYADFTTPFPPPPGRESHFFGRNATAAFTAIQTIYLPDLGATLDTRQKTFTVSGAFWENTALRVEFLSRDGRIVGTWTIGTGAGGWSLQSVGPVNVPFGASRVRATLDFGPGVRGIGGAESLSFVINP